MQQKYIVNQNSSRVLDHFASYNVWQKKIHWAVCVSYYSLQCRSNHSRDKFSFLNLSPFFGIATMGCLRISGKFSLCSCSIVLPEASLVIMLLLVFHAEKYECLGHGSPNHVTNVMPA